MEHRRVVASADKLANARGGHLRVLLSQIHRDLTDKHIVALAALAEHMLLGNIVMTAHLFENVIDSQRMVVNLDSTLDDSFSQPHVNTTVIDDAIGHERVDHALKIAYRTVGSLGDELNDISRNLQTITAALGMEDVNTELYIRLLHLSNEPTGETRQHAVLQPVKIDWWTVGGKDNLLAKTEQMVEDMEEGSYCPLCRCPLLHVIDNQYINGLVEVDEVVDGVASAGVGELHLEQAGRDIKHTLLWVHLLAPYANSIDEVRLTTT